MTMTCRKCNQTIEETMCIVCGVPDYCEHGYSTCPALERDEEGVPI